MELGSDLRISMATQFLGYSTLNGPFRLQYALISRCGSFQLAKAMHGLYPDNQYILKGFQIISDQSDLNKKEQSR